MSHFQDQGRATYKRKDYAKAIELFDRAIGRAPSSQLYDNRAACHEKLDDFPSALGDAKKAIQLAREDPTGYLRAGRILLKMEKRETAYEIYSYGMRSIKHVGQGYELLRKAQAALMKELSPPKSVDPLTMLPPELAVQILEYLSFKQLMKACLVSKEWTRFIRGNPDLWSHLDLSQARRKVGNKFISRAINTARKKMRAVTLHNLYDFHKVVHALLQHSSVHDVTLLDTGMPDRAVAGIVGTLPHLRRLHIGSGTLITPAVLVDILSKARTLQILRCDDLCCTSVTPVPETAYNSIVSPLTDCKVAWKGTLSGWAEVVESILKQPALQGSLRRLQLSGNGIGSRAPGHGPMWVDYRPLKNLERIELDFYVRKASEIALPGALKGLKLDFQHQSRGDFFDDIDSAKWPTQSLEEISLQVDGEYFCDCIRILDGQGSDESPVLLRSLRVAGCDLKPHWGRQSDWEADLRLSLKHPRLTALADLSLEQARCCDDAVMGIIAEMLPKLRVLNMSETDITGVGLRQVVQNGHIKRLVVNDCRNLGRDAVAWARSQGVDVVCKQTEIVEKGKKVRFSNN
ncbi:hypothetical protein LTR95_011115 [Oleoguttula sp. CCFEE 5521]